VTSGCTLWSVRPMLASSLQVMMTTDSCMNRVFRVLRESSAISAVQAFGRRVHREHQRTGLRTRHCLIAECRRMKKKNVRAFTFLYFFI
jgi:DNA-binding transcriptional regulator YhcF (GntR family)